MTASGRQDRRIARTRHALRDALMALIVEKGYEAITIQDITDRADINRATFYLHFRDKDELLYKSMEAVYNDLLAQARALDADAIRQGDMTSLRDTSDWDHLAAHKDFYRVILSERGSAAFMLKVQRYLAKVMQEEVLRCFVQPGTQPRIPLEIIAYSCAGAQIGVMSWWLASDSLIPPREMADIMFDLLTYGVIQAVTPQPTP